jgi:hypothetical protein
VQSGEINTAGNEDGTMTPSLPDPEKIRSFDVHAHVMPSTHPEEHHVYIDLSGWSPKCSPPQLIEYTNTVLKHKILNGPDYCPFTPERWFADFEQAPIRDEVRPLILKYNTARLPGLQMEDKSYGGN